MKSYLSTGINRKNLFSSSTSAMHTISMIHVYKSNKKPENTKGFGTNL